MVWQRAGAVSVQNGSTTVTGAGVDFAASSRVGDSFIGPDGATYEVANVASATVISILPAYKGATVSGAAYAIMPVQGYDKMLSDAFNSLNNQFGPKLAALGTTGNYDILPVTKGGTGGSTQSEARAGLGLGTAAVANIGIAGGNVMAVGTGGILAQQLPTRTSVYNTEGTGVWQGNPQATTTSDLPGSTYGSILQLQYGTANLSFLFFDALANQFYFRSIYSGSAQAWKKVYHEGNTTRAADGTLKAI